jgi:hypothetical protein
MTDKEKPADYTFGRPSEYTPEKAEKICKHLAEGRTLGAISRMPGMPTRQTVYNWLREFNDFFDLYTRAKRLQLDAFTDDIVDSAEMLDDNAQNHVACQNRKLQVDTKKWYVSHLAPKVPTLNGSYADQARQIISSYTAGDLNESRATTLMQLLNAQAAFVSLDDYRKEMAEIKNQLNEIKNKQIG